MNNKIMHLGTISLLALASAYSMAADVSQDIKSCVACHGPDGVSQKPDMPTIGGISEFSHADALYAYKDGDRACQPPPMMCSIAKGLSDEQIKAIAAYFAEKPFVAAKQKTDPGKAALGKEIHERDCEGCHSEGGSNPGDDASILAGQWMAYLELALKEYAAGKRAQPEAMEAAIKELGDADLEALAHYYGSQQ